MPSLMGGGRRRPGRAGDVTEFSTASRRKHMAGKAICVRFRQRCCPIVCTFSFELFGGRDSRCWPKSVSLPLKRLQSRPTSALTTMNEAEYREVIIEIARPAGAQDLADGNWRTIGEIIFENSRPSAD